MTLTQGVGLLELGVGLAQAAEDFLAAGLLLKAEVFRWFSREPLNLPRGGRAIIPRSLRCSSTTRVIPLHPDSEPAPSRLPSWLHQSGSTGYKCPLCCSRRTMPEFDPVGLRVFPQGLVRFAQVSVKTRGHGASDVVPRVVANPSVRHFGTLDPGATCVLEVLRRDEEALPLRDAVAKGKRPGQIVRQRGSIFSCSPGRRCPASPRQWRNSDRFQSPFGVPGWPQGNRPSETQPNPARRVGTPVGRL
jgi:hypothetical protein